MAKRSGTIAKLRVTEFRFHIDAFTPATMPMARLAEYMKHVAEMLGEQSAVHFSHLEPGSTTLVNCIEREAVPKVRARAQAIVRRDAPRDALASYRHVNQMLREDNAVAYLQENKRGPKIIEFPGRKEAQDQVTSVKQAGTLDGQLLRVGGRSDKIPILLQAEGQEVAAGVWAERAVAKRLAAHLFEPVRLIGDGRWARDAEGQWVLADFHVHSFKVLEEISLPNAVKRLRTIGGSWTEETFADLTRIRQGDD